MINIFDKVEHLLSIVFNKNRCSKCFRPYSKNSAFIEISNIWRSRRAIGVSTDPKPIYTMTVFDYNNREVLRKSSVNHYHQVLGITVKCSCGSFKEFVIPDKDSQFRNKR